MIVGSMQLPGFVHGWWSIRGQDCIQRILLREYLVYRGSDVWQGEHAKAIAHHVFS
jgi:hypothetical protein